MDNLKENKLLVFTAPSGSGKTTVVRHLLKTFDELAFSVSATTRDRRDHERHGHDYFFLSVETFQKWMKDSAFVEWEEVYDDQYYGTLKFEIERLWELGKKVVLDIDVKGAVSIQNIFPEQTKVVFIKVPTLEILIERLKARKTETDASLRKRIQRVKKELAFETKFDEILINDVLEETLSKAENIVKKYLNIKK